MPAKPVCLGSGLVALDVIYDGENGGPRFLAGGSCGNVLTILSYLGWNSFPLARLGDDPEGDRIIGDMKRWNVKTRFVRREPEIHSPRIIERIFAGKRPRHQFYLKCTHGNRLPRRRPYPPRSLESIRHRLPKSDVFYFDRADPAALEAARTLKKRGAVIVFEPPKFLHNEVFLQCLKIADIVKHCHDQSGETAEFGIRIPLEIRTGGENGLRYMARFLRNRSWRQMEAFPVSGLLDAAGSGDWLTAGLIHVLERGGPWRSATAKKLEAALGFGQALASLNCNFTGARGVMYGLARPRLLWLAEKVASGESPVIKTSRAPRMRPAPPPRSPKCRVCLCSN